MTVEVFYIETPIVILFITRTFKSDNKVVKSVKMSFIFPLVILCIVTAYSFFSLFYPEKIASFFKKSNRGLVQFAEVKQSRTLASVQQLQPLIINCADQFETYIQVTTSQVLLNFKDCENQVKADDIKLVNQTNLYMAQIFRSSQSTLATDFIQLAKGENILNFEISLNGKQKKTQIIKIERISTEIQ